MCRTDVKNMKECKFIPVQFVRLLAALVLTAVLLPGCIIVKGEKEEAAEQSGAVAPRPSIPMSEEIVRSEQGDMIAFLPDAWFFMDVREKVSSSVFAVAVNPDYTASLVFSELRRDDALDEVFGREGLIGVARASFLRRERKTAGLVKNTGSFDVRSLGTKKFGVYEYTGANDAFPTRVAVFRSSLGNYYECTLAPLPFTGRTLPSKEEMEKIYSSVLTTIDY